MIYRDILYTVLGVILAIVVLFLFVGVGALVIKTNKNPNKNQGPTNRFNKFYHYSKTEEHLKFDVNKKITPKTKRKDVKDLILVFNSIWRVLKEIADFNIKQSQLIKPDCDALFNYLINKRLKTMDVSNINRNGSRIQIAVLKGAHLKTIGDLVKYPKRFDSIPGIGEVSARKIKNNLELIYEEVKMQTIVKLSYDDKNQFSNELVKTIDIYLKADSYVKDANELLKLKPEVDSIVTSINLALISPALLFKPKESFEKISSLYEELIAIYTEHFANLNEELVAPFNKVKSMDSSEAWEDFVEDPISFNKIIEHQYYYSNKTTLELGEYGLASDIAKKVKETPLNLDGLKLSLRTYQEWGTKYIICQKKTIIGDEMGLGKTVEAIAAMVSLSNDGLSRFMVVCPLSVLTNWCREIYKFSSLNCYRVYGEHKNSAVKKWIDNGGVAVTTYESLKSFASKNYFDIDLLIVDEAHYIKNSSTIRTANTLEMINRSQRVSFLTGTVLENKVDEMIQLISYLNKTVSIEATNTVKYYGNSVSKTDEFKRIVGNVYFRRKRTDVLAELPEKTEAEVWCDLNKEEFNIYRESIISHSFAEARRVSWNANPSISTKMNRLKEIVEMAKEDNRKVLVFSFFLSVVDSIYKEFGNSAYGPINGSVSSEERQKIIDKFDESPAGSVLVCQINSGGVGLNIQSASVVVICEPQFKPSIENQAISRSYRMGQARKVLVYHLLATNTVDERLNDILTAKQKEFDNYADNSSVAEVSFQIDTKMFSGIMEKEYSRIIQRDSEPGVDNDEDVSEAIENEVIEPKEAEVQKEAEEKQFIPSPKGGLSVTNRIKKIKQPRGGYLPLKLFEEISLPIENELGEENIGASLVGTAVDYLSRYMNGTSKEEAFKISLLGAKLKKELDVAKKYLSYINKTLDDDTIKSALKLTGYDVVYRAGLYYYDTIDITKPDAQTIQNVREMVNRSLEFFKQYGPIIKDGFTFEGGYTDAISSGDGDFMTEDTLWDFKVIKNKPNSQNTLQILIYYLMGIHSIHPEFKNIKYVGFFNPRLNKVYRYRIDKLPKSIRDEVEKYVIGY